MEIKLTMENVLPVTFKSADLTVSAKDRLERPREDV